VSFILIERCYIVGLAQSHLQVVELDGPLFCLSWCKRKRWLLVGGKAQLHVYSVCSACSTCFARHMFDQRTPCVACNLSRLVSAVHALNCKARNLQRHWLLSSRKQCLTVFPNLASLQQIDEQQLHAQNLQCAWLYLLSACLGGHGCSCSSSSSAACPTRE